jgi:predicted phage gp36 major capsid-like protein
MNSEVDINVLVGLYNQKIAALTNQNILLEAKLQSLTKDFEVEKEQLLAQLLDARREQGSLPKQKSSKKTDDYQNSEVE